MARILIVEDEHVILILAESVLQEAGHELKSASTVAEAEALIDSDEKIDLVFTDIGLQDELEGGISIGALVQQTRPGTPILNTSARTLTDGMKSLFVEPSGFLPKPYTAQELKEAINILDALPRQPKD
jgi:DNA-binding NtrC family response regulator